MALTTHLQKDVQCIKCKEFNCVPIPDKYGFASCVYCGGTQDRRYSPPELTDYKLLYGYLFDEEYIEDEEDKNWDLNIL